jgi:hypothetical protein
MRDLFCGGAGLLVPRRNGALVEEALEGGFPSKGHFTTGGRESSYRRALVLEGPTPEASLSNLLPVQWLPRGTNFDATASFLRYAPPFLHL